MTTNEISDTDQLALDFAKKHNVKLEVISKEYAEHFEEDKENGVFRWVFKMKLSCNGRSYTFKFGQSIKDDEKEPTVYDVLGSVQKYDVGSFEDFLREFGYDEDFKMAERIYKRVCKEFAEVERIFTSDQLEELQEIA